MSLENGADAAPAEGDAGVQSEAGIEEGQSADAEAGIEEGQSKTVAQTGGEPNGVEGLPEGMTPEALYKQHKNLQADYSKRTDADKARVDQDAALAQKFAPYGGMDQLLQNAAFLSSDPGFKEYLERLKSNQQNEQYLGEDPDEDSVRALKTVTSVANDSASKMKNELRNELMEEFINPMVQKAQAEHMDNVFKQMDNDPDVGDYWRDHQDAMQSKVSLLPKSENGNFSVNDLKTVLFSTLLEKGEFNQVMAKSHNNKLAKLKANSIEPSPGATNKTARGQFTDWLKAAEDAKARVMGG